jgi:hypothetical protein
VERAFLALTDIAWFLQVSVSHSGYNSQPPRAELMGASSFEMRGVAIDTRFCSFGINYDLDYLII